MNMKKLAVIIDSTGVDISRINQNADIYMQPLSITFGDTTYTDIIDLNPETFYEMIQTNPHHPSTSQPVLGEIIETFERLLKEYKNILCISLTSQLSGTYSGFLQAIQLLETDRIAVVDTKITGPAELLLAEYALQLSEQNFNFVDIVKSVNQHINFAKLFIYIDTLTYLAKSGRLSSAKALVGNLIQMKTNLAFRNGKPEVIDRVRTAKKGIFKMIDAAIAECDVKTKTLYLVYSSAKRPEILDEIHNYILEKLPFVSIRETIIPAVLGCNSGPGGIGLTFINQL